MTAYELDHWVLFDTLSTEQVSRLKKVLADKVAPDNSLRAEEKPKMSFQAMLEAETAKLK